MVVAYVKSSWCCIGDKRPAVIAAGVGAGPKRGVVVVVVVVVALEAWLIVKH